MSVIELLKNSYLTLSQVLASGDNELILYKFESFCSNFERWIVSNNGSDDDGFAYLRHIKKLIAKPFFSNITHDQMKSFLKLLVSFGSKNVLSRYADECWGIIIRSIFFAFSVDFIVDWENVIDPFMMYTPNDSAKYGELLPVNYVEQLINGLKSKISSISMQRQVHIYHFLLMSVISYFISSPFRPNHFVHDCGKINIDKISQLIFKYLMKCIDFSPDFPVFTGSNHALSMSAYIVSTNIKKKEKYHVHIFNYMKSMFPSDLVFFSTGIDSLSTTEAYFSKDVAQMLRTICFSLISPELNHPELHLMYFGYWMEIWLYEIRVHLLDEIGIVDCLLRLRALWIVLNNNKISQESLMIIATTMHESLVGTAPILTISMLLTFLFDIKMEAPPFWDFAFSLIQGENTLETICTELLSQLAVSFSPLFFGFSQDQLAPFYSSYSIQEGSNIFLKRCSEIFTNPVIFEREVYRQQPPEKQNLFFHISCIGWDKTSSLLFVRNIFDLFNLNDNFCVYRSFVDTLLYIQKSIPIQIKMKYSFICDEFLPLFLEIISDLNDSQFHRSIFSTCLDIFSHSSMKTIASENVKTQFEMTIIHFLMLKNKESIQIGLNAASLCLVSLAPHSFVLVPFIIYCLKYSRSMIMSFISTISSMISICTNQNSIVVPSDIYQNLELWYESGSDIENKSLLGEIISKINSHDLTYNCEELLKETLSATLDCFNSINVIQDPNIIRFPIFVLISSIESNLLSIKEAIPNLFKPFLDQLNVLGLHHLSILKIIPQFIGNIEGLSDMIVNSIISLIQIDQLGLPKYTFAINLLVDIVMYHHRYLSEFELYYIRKAKSLPKTKFNALLNALEYLYSSTVSFNSESIIPNNMDCYILQRNKFAQALKKDGESLLLMTKRLIGSHTYQISAISTDGRPKTRERFDYSGVFEESHFEEKVITIADSFKEEFENAKGIQMFKSSDFEFSLPNNGTRPPKKLRFNNDAKCSIPSLPMDTTLFNERFMPAPMALFFSLLYDFIDTDFIIEKSNSKNTRYMNSIFSTNPHDTSKIGLVYVAEGQVDQKSILSNGWDNVSLSFKEFLTSIGEFVDLECHEGYIGLLDKLRLTNGKYSLYFSTNRNEVMYHVAPMMPTDQTDDQQLKKKRHIGNDPVHIVWSEHFIDYDPFTISSQFNDAHIVIYPLSSGLYRVVVHKKNSELFFGPLFEQTIIHGKSLGSLVRWTALMADGAVQLNSQKPLPQDIYDEVFTSASLSIQTE